MREWVGTETGVLVLALRDIGIAWRGIFVTRQKIVLHLLECGQVGPGLGYAQCFVLFFTSEAGHVVGCDRCACKT